MNGALEQVLKNVEEDQVELVHTATLHAKEQAGRGEEELVEVAVVGVFVLPNLVVRVVGSALLVIVH